MGTLLPGGGVLVSHSVTFLASAELYTPVASYIPGSW
jgi:hypothetical protein